MMKRTVLPALLIILLFLLCTCTRQKTDDTAQSLVPFAPPEAEAPTPKTSADPPSAEAPPSVAQPVSVREMPLTGDWGGYIATNSENYGNIPFLLRLTDENSGLFAYCNDLSNSGAGCGHAVVERISDSQISVTVTDWIYQDSYNGELLFPKSYSFTLTYLSNPERNINKELTKISVHNTEEPNDIFYTLSADEPVQELVLLRVKDDGTPSYKHEYDGLNGVIETVFGFNESGADNIHTTHIFVIPNKDGSLRLRFIYTTLDKPVLSDYGDWGIPELTKAHGIDGGGNMGTAPFEMIWYPAPDGTIKVDGQRFKNYYQNIVIPRYIRLAQLFEWEDNFEEYDKSEWNEELYLDNLSVLMYKKLIFAAQEIIADRFDGYFSTSQDFRRDGENIIFGTYNPEDVIIERYDPRTDPDSFFETLDLDLDGVPEEVAIRLYRYDGATDLPPEGAMLFFNRVFFTNLQGIPQPRFFVADIDTSDNTKELAFVSKQREGYGVIGIYRYNQGKLELLGYIWGVMDTEFDATGEIPTWNGDGSVTYYNPLNGIYETVTPKNEGGIWIGGTYFY